MKVRSWMVLYPVSRVKPAIAILMSSSSLRQKSTTSGVYTSLSQAFVAGTQVISTIILARFLTPHEFGVVAIATTMFTLVFYIVDIGLSDATIRSTSFIHQRVNGLFWFSLAFGAVLTCSFIAISPLVSNFFGFPELETIMFTLSFCFFLNNLSTQHRALLTRDMRFDKLLLVQTIPILIGTSLAILAAFYGLSYWALVIQQLSISLFTSILPWFFHSYRPSLKIDLNYLIESIRFGRRLAIFNILMQSSRNSDRLILGYGSSTSELGQYTRAISLLIVPLSQVIIPLGKIAVPALSRLKSDMVKFRNYYCELLTVISYSLFIPIALIASISHDLILLLLGENWLVVGSLFLILAPACVIQSLINSIVWVLTALGFSKKLSNWSLVCSPLIVLFYLTSVSYGSIGMSYAYTASFFLIQVPGLFYLLRNTPISMKDIVYVCWRPITIGIVTYLLIETIDSSIIINTSFYRVIVKITIGLIFCILMILTWRSSRQQLYSITNSIKSLIHSRRN